MTDDEAAFLFPTAPECPECDGTGEVVGHDDEERTCPRCGGSGFDMGDTEGYDVPED